MMRILVVSTCRGGSFATGDLDRADRWERKVRSKELPSTRNQVGAGDELIDIENRPNALEMVNTVAELGHLLAVHFCRRQSGLGSARL